MTHKTILFFALIFSVGMAAQKQQDTPYSFFGIGTLLYLIKQSRPEISNYVRELTKVLNNGTIKAFCEILRVIKYINDTNNVELKLDPKLKFDKDRNLILILEGINDST